MSDSYLSTENEITVNNSGVDQRKNYSYNIYTGEKNMIEKGKLIAQGSTAEVYDYDSDRILKLYRNGMPDYACENEFEIT